MHDNICGNLERRVQLNLFGNLGITDFQIIPRRWIRADTKDINRDRRQTLAANHFVTTIRQQDNRLTVRHIRALRERHNRPAQIRIADPLSRLIF